LAEETGLSLNEDNLRPIGFINSDHQDVSSVHFGVVYLAHLDHLDADDSAILQRVTAQAEPDRAQWLCVGDLPRMVAPSRAPGGGSFEDWSRIVISGYFQGTQAENAESAGAG
jgi:predicted NUDIX family phosphoesterase